MFAELSGGAVTLFGVIIVLCTAIFGAVWRVGNKIGGMTQHLIANDDRLDRLEQHEDDHDKWHLRRGDH